MAIDTPAGIVHSFDNALYSIKPESVPSTLSKLRSLEGILNAYAFGEHVHVVTEEYQENELANLLGDVNRTSLRLEKIQPTIEDCFIQLMRTNG